MDPRSLSFAISGIFFSLLLAASRLRDSTPRSSTKSFGCRLSNIWLTLLLAVLTSGVKLWRSRPQDSLSEAGRSQSSSYRVPKAASVSAVRAWIAISGVLSQINAHLPCIRTLPICVNIHVRRFQPGVRTLDCLVWIQEPQGKESPESPPTILSLHVGSHEL